jgi:indole-3-glycerol phosphate synthase
MTLLDDILNVKRETLQSKKGKRYLQEIRSKILDAEPTRGFNRALSIRQEGSPRLIAEIKKASPSKGVIRERFDPVEIAKIYEGGGAAALSILTEEHFFFGKPSYLSEVRRAVSLPILQKDFILDEIQVYEARAWGADAILLIVALLDRRQTKDYFDLARDLNLDVLIEIHTEKELEGIIEWAPLIGINNRNLKTFVTDLKITFRVLKEVPEDRTVVSESGIRSRKEVEQLYDAGVDAILVGESLMASDRIEEKMKELLGA